MKIKDIIDKCEKFEEKYYFDNKMNTMILYDVVIYKLGNGMLMYEEYIDTPDIIELEPILNKSIIKIRVIEDRLCLFII